MQGAGTREEAGMARLLLCDPSPHPESSGSQGLGLGGCLPTPPGTLKGGLAGALRTVLLGPGGEVPAPGPTLPLRFPTQRSQPTTALGRFLEDPAHLQAHGDPGR